MIQEFSFVWMPVVVYFLLQFYSFVFQTISAKYVGFLLRLVNPKLENILKVLITMGILILWSYVFWNILQSIFALSPLIFFIPSWIYCTILLILFWQWKSKFALFRFIYSKIKRRFLPVQNQKKQFNFLNSGKK